MLHKQLPSLKLKMHGGILKGGRHSRVKLFVKFCLATCFSKLFDYRTIFIYAHLVTEFHGTQFGNCARGCYPSFFKIYHSNNLE